MLPSASLDVNNYQVFFNQSIGILICKTKDDEVIQYAMNRSMSPTMIAEYETKLIDKKVLQRKVHEFTEGFDFKDD